MSKNRKWKKVLEKTHFLEGLEQNGLVDRKNNFRFVIVIFFNISILRRQMMTEMMTERNSRNRRTIILWDYNRCNQEVFKTFVV